MFEPVLLRRARLKLPGNAIKYSPEGGENRFSVLDRAESAIKSIGEEGIGIPGGHMDGLFEGFYRANNVGSI